MPRGFACEPSPGMSTWLPACAEIWNSKYFCPESGSSVRLGEMTWFAEALFISYFFARFDLSDSLRRAPSHAAWRRWCILADIGP